MRPLRKLWLPLLAVVTTGILFHFASADYREVGLAAFESFRTVAKYGLGIAMFLSVAAFGERVIRLVVLEGLVASALGAPVPRVLSQLSSLLVYGAAGLAISGILFEQDLTVLWAASGVAGIVLGMALQQMLTDVFAGLAMNFDAPFRLGDSVELQLGDGRLEGRIQEVSWRTTQLITPQDNVAVVPNARMAAAIVTNRCKPVDRSRLEVTLRVAAIVPPARVLRILGAAAWEAAVGDDGAAPRAMARGITKGHVDYAVSLAVPVESHDQVRDKVLDRLCAHLGHAGLLPATARPLDGPMLDLPGSADCRAALAATFLFRDAGDPCLSALVGLARLDLRPAGAVLYAAGETVTSSALVLEGLLRVTGRPGGRAAAAPAFLGPGSLVGVESLLLSTAQPASVACLTETLLLIVERDALAGLLRQTPALAGVLSRALANRMGEGDDLAADLLRQLRLSFGLRPASAREGLAWTA